MTAATRTTGALRVAVEADDARVAASLRQLIASDPDIAVTDTQLADVVVVELAPTAGAGAGIRIGQLACSRSVVVLGFEDHVQQAVSRLVNVTFLDKLDAGTELIPVLHQVAARRAEPAATPATSASWSRIAVVTAAVFAGPWAFWFSAIAQAHGIIGWRLPQGLALWSIAPLLAAAVAVTSGRAGLRDLGARITRFRAPARTYAAAAALPLLIAGLTAAMVTATGGTVPYGQLLSLPAALLYLVYGTGLFLLTEEAAWRGTLLPRVQHRLGAGAASLVIGAIWACWHLPLLANPDASDHGLPVAPFLVLIVATSVLMTGLVNAAGGSVVVTGLFHASFDACYSWVGVVGDQHQMLWTATAITAVMAAGVLAITRGELFQQSEGRGWVDKLGRGRVPASTGSARAATAGTRLPENG